MTEIIELNTKKRIRAGHRSSVKRLEAKSEEILDSVATNPSSIQEHVAALTQLKMSVQAKLSILKELDDDILKRTKDEEVENEIEQSDMLTERIHKMVVEIDIALSKQTSQSQQGASNSATNSQNTSPARPTNQAKLPKLQMKTFNGKVTEWQPFIDCFDSAVHSNSSLNEIDKMNYLKSLLDGPALAAISGLSLTSSNYKTARDILQQRYGNKQLLISAHMDELLALPQVKSVTDIKGIRQIYDKTEINLRGLQNLGVESKQYGSLLIPILLNKLPQELRLIISRKFESNDGWQLDELLKVFKTEVEARERCTLISCNDTVNTKSDRKPTHSRSPISAAALFSPEPQKIHCTFCNGEHKTVDCTVINTLEERRKIVRKQGRCFNCLRRNHMASDCKDKRNCMKCSRRHHTSLCPRDQAGTNDNLDSKASASSQVFNSPTTSMYVDSKTSVLLQTCIAQASSSVECSTQSTLVRILLDSGSQRTYITQQLKERLNLKPKSTERLLIKSFGQDTDKVQTVELVNLSLTNPTTMESVVITAYVVPMICSPLCNQEVKFAKEHYSHLTDITLSESLCKDSEALEVHVLIGSDNYWSVVSGETRRGNGGPVAMKTKFGWTISGPVNNVLRTNTASVNLTSTHVLKVGNTVCDDELDKKLERFWTLESIGIDTDVDPVLESFSDNIVYHDNRYEVPLPWKEIHDPLPDNFAQSERRLRTLLQRLQSKRDILKEYDSVIKDQCNKGIIERVYDTDERNNVHYLPHHCVLREDKETTKLRIVYDASSRQNGPSLNDCLYSGPSLTPDLFDIILRFRLQPTSVIADIEKAFLMISIQEGDRDFLRFLWVDDPFSPQPQLVTYRFTRVVFGVTSSPFLLNATLRKLITDYKHEDPEFAELMLRSLYVDDLTTSVKDVETGYKLFVDARKRMARGGFNLRKWLSNSTELMERISKEDCNSKTQLSSNDESQCREDDETYNRATVGGLKERDEKTEQKVLGINWNYVNDELVFKFHKHVENAQLLEPTRRNVLRVIAGFYDPMGLISPIIIQMKILLQEICKQDCPWDSPLTPELNKRWFNLIADLKETTEVNIPRCVNLNEGECQFQLAGFCDASTLAYAAVVYLIVKSQNTVTVQLIASKTRVAPLKKQTVPRLELLGALILARLMNKVKKAISQSITVSHIRCWTDSMNVLHWILNNKEWKQFINTRVTEIRQLLPTTVWNHVPGPENPADIASRGTSASALLHNDLWWNGPPWLLDSPDTKDVVNLEDSEVPSECLKEMKIQALRQLQGTTTLLIETGTVKLSNVMKCEEYSDIHKLYRVTAYVLRAVNNFKSRLKSSTNKVKIGNLTGEEIISSEKMWLKEVQLSMRNQRGFTDTCKQLGVVTDEMGVMRCTGRLGKSTLPEYTRHPILIPNYHHLSKLIIEDAHNRVMHNGVRETLNELRTMFWIIRGRQTVRKVLHKCWICRRHEGMPYKSETVSEMPAFRFKEGRAFAATGVDFAGPLYLKVSGNTQSSKAYICLFTCGSTRATHLELAPSLTTPAFIRCLRRFIARRGIPEVIISDNAKTFKAATKELSVIFNDQDTTSFMATHRIQWKFNLEKAPWWGGFFERLVKCTKRCLKKVLSKSRLTYEEMLTVLTEVECVLNSRPLTYLYTDDVEEPLTPSHLMVGHRLLSLPVSQTTIDLPSTQASVRRRAVYLNQLLGRFWNQWRREYVTSLRETHRLSKSNQGQVIRVGDSVCIHDENLQRTLWKTGVVEELIQGADNKVRGAVVRTSKNGRIWRLRRPVQRLCPLEVQEDNQEEVPKDTPVEVKEDAQEEARNDTDKDVADDDPKPRRKAAVEGERRRRLTNVVR